MTQTNPTHGILCLTSLFRPIFNPVVTVEPSDVIKTTFAIFFYGLFSLMAVFISENMPFAFWEPRLCKESKHVLTSKSSASTNSTYIPSFSITAIFLNLSQLHIILVKSHHLILFWVSLLKSPLSLKSIKSCRHSYFHTNYWGKNVCSFSNWIISPNSTYEWLCLAME